jgi:hypothetical protein
MQHFQEHVTYANIPTVLDYIWIAYDYERQSFLVSARRSNLPYEGELAVKGGQYLGAGVSLQAAIVVANIAASARDGGYPYGIRISEDARRTQLFWDSEKEQAEEDLVRSIAAHRQKVIEEIDNAWESSKNDMDEVFLGYYEFYSS